MLAGAALGGWYRPAAGNLGAARGCQPGGAGRFGAASGRVCDAAPLFEAAGLSGLIDDGFVGLDETAAAEFIPRCAQLRFWPRQLSAARARAR